MRIFSSLAVVALLITRADASETVQVETLKGPVSERFKAQIYARNVWDLQVFAGRLYVGTGNSSNAGPHSNAGPVPVWSRDLKSGQWKTEFTIDDEQIEVFRVLDGALTIPGHDPREDWSKGNFYRFQAGKWTKTRTIPNGIHTYDMAHFAGRTWAALGTQGNFQLASSGDGGQSWRTYPSATGRTYTLQSFENRLFGWGMIPLKQASERIAAIKDEKRRAEMQNWLNWSVYEVLPDETLVPRPDLNRETLFPDAPAANSWAKLVRPTVFKGELLYIGGTVHNDHQSDPFGVYAVSSLQAGAFQTRRLIVDEEKPWDIEVDANRAHILTSRKITREGVDEFQISVWSSTDAKKWTRTLQFSQPTFARSFARDGDDWYFGLGTDVGAGWENKGIASYTRDLRPEAGTILRVAR